MNSITGWHPFKTALIVSLPYLLVCEIIYCWYSSGSTDGFLIGGILLSNLLMLSWLLFGRNAYYTAQNQSTYLGCQNDSVTIDAARAFIEVQTEIGITSLVIFICIFLPPYITFIITKFLNRHDLPQQPFYDSSITTRPLFKKTLIYCFYYLLVCEAIYLSLNAVHVALGFILMILFAALISPSTLILDIYGFRIREFSIQYLGCQSEPAIEHYGLIIMGQARIFNSLMVLFIFLFLTKYCTFIVRNLTLTKQIDR